MSDERYDDRQFWLPALYQEQWVPMVRLAALLVRPDQPDLAGAEMLVRDVLVEMYRTDATFHSWAHVVSTLRANVTSAARGVPAESTGQSSTAEHPDALPALAGLPHRLRDVVILKLYAGTRLAETADALGITRRAARRRWQRVMVELTRICDQPDRDSLEETLGEALRGVGDRLAPGDYRAEVLEQARIAPERRRSWANRAVVVAVLVAALAAGFGLSTLWSAPSNQADPAASTAVTVSGPDQTGSDSSAATTQDGVQVFYLGRSDGLLYREVRNLPTVGDRLNTAVAAVLNVAPLDPEYISSWSGGQVNKAGLTGNRITLDLSQSAFAQFRNRGQEESAIQQLVYAATAAVENGAGMWVRVLVDGSPNLPLIGKPQSDFRRAGPNALGPMWVDSPLAGVTVDPGTMKISGVVKSTLPPPQWQLYSVSRKKTVALGSVTTGGVGHPWTGWSQEVLLPDTAGEYRVGLTIGTATVWRTITVS